MTAAFFVENFRERRSAERRAAQIAGVLYRDLTDYIRVSRRILNEIETGLAEWERRRAEGGRPVPYVLRIPGSESPPITVWQASMASGVADLLEPALVGELGFFYSEITGSAEKYTRYSIFTERSVWPVLESDTTGFYEPETGELRPEFMAHYRLLREIRSDMERYVEWAEELVAELRAAVPGIAGPHTAAGLDPGPDLD